MQRALSLPTTQKRLSHRAQRRLVRVGNQLWWVTIDGDGIGFREYQHKGTMRLDWLRALETTERLPQQSTLEGAR